MSHFKKLLSNKSLLNTSRAITGTLFIVPRCVSRQYCRYGLKHYIINQSINQSTNQSVLFFPLSKAPTLLVTPTPVWIAGHVTTPVPPPALSMCVLVPPDSPGTGVKVSVQDPLFIFPEWYQSYFLLHFQICKNNFSKRSLNE